ncbi:MAG TPA: acylphosphatase [Myxococcales bacterium]|nr:acylphosphatase [Myxococcales bacterium]
MTDLLRIHVFVTGRVQGVWFRQATRERATQLGVGGWVRNLPDGRVEAMFEGAPDAVRDAVAFVHDGPPLARVETVEGDEEALDDADLPIGGSFQIR